MKNYCHLCHQADELFSPALPQNSIRVQLNCRRCARDIQLIDITEASAIAHKSRRTIYKWISNGWVQTVSLTDGRQLIVYSSLFNRVDAKVTAAGAVNV